MEIYDWGNEDELINWDNFVYTQKKRKMQDEIPTMEKKILKKN